MAGQNRDRAVELFGKHDAHELVRPGHASKGDGEIGALPQILVEPVGPADCEHDVALPVIADLAEPFGELDRIKGLAAFVEENEKCALRQVLLELGRFLGFSLV